MNLDAETFKTFLKTSTTREYRFYYLLNDDIYNGIVKSLKNNDVTELEEFIDHFIDEFTEQTIGTSSSLKDKRLTTRMLENIKTIDDLIVIVEKYRARCNVIFDLLRKQERKIRGFPFQLMLRGMFDLSKTLKRIVRLMT